MKKLIAILMISVLWLTMVVTISADSGDTVSYPVNLTVAYPAWDVVVTPLSFSQMAGTVTTNFPTVQNNTVADIRLASLTITATDGWTLTRVHTLPAAGSKKIHWVEGNGYQYPVNTTTTMTMTTLPGTNSDILAKKSSTTVFSNTREVTPTITHNLAFLNLYASSLPTAPEGTYQIATIDIILVWA